MFSKKISKKLFLILIIFLLIIGYFLYHFIVQKKSLNETNAKIVEVFYAKKTTLQETAKFIGTIHPQHVTALMAKSKGILDRLVNSGQKVKKGTLIARIINAEVEHNYKLIEEMEQIAKEQHDRYLTLNQRGVTSPNDLAEKKSNWIQIQRQKFDAKQSVDDLYLIAPFDGIVGIFKIREGSEVHEGEIIVNFYDPNSIIVEFDVPLSLIPSIHDGSLVRINERTYPLTYIQKMLDEDSHMSPAYVNIVCNECIMGATIDVNVVIAEKKNALIIPYEATFLKQNHTYVYRAIDNKAILTEVTLGIRERKDVEILSGLKEDEAVIVTGQTQLFPNAPIRIHSENDKNMVPS